MSKDLLFLIGASAPPDGEEAMPETSSRATDGAGAA